MENRKESEKKKVEKSKFPESKYHWQKNSE